MFDDPSYDDARAKAHEIGSFLRLHGPFEPHRLPLNEMEYTTMPLVAAKLADRWTDLSDTEAASTSPTAATDSAEPAPADTE